MKIMNIKDFIKSVFNSKSNVQLKYSFGKLTEKQVNEIKENTSIDLTGYSRVIDSYGVKHTIKQHGNKIQEQKRGQIEITIKDFENISKIVNNPDKIENAGKNKIGRYLIKIKKRLSENNYYTEEIRKKQKEIALQTFYKRKNR